MAESHKKILCIEDDRETAALIAEELVDRGYEVTVAHDGREGLAAILRTMPDLVLSDISMPVMSGFELLERLIALAPRFSKMPFVFLTALTDRDNELRGRQLGADDARVGPRQPHLRLPHRRSRSAPASRVADPRRGRQPISRLRRPARGGPARDRAEA